jgi:hypothetical protein
LKDGESWLFDRPNVAPSTSAIFVIFEQHPAKVVEKQFINENRLAGTCCRPTDLSVSALPAKRYLFHVSKIRVNLL